MPAARGAAGGLLTARPPVQGHIGGHDISDVPEPRRAILDEAAERARCVEIVIQDTGATGSPADRMDTGEGA